MVYTYKSKLVVYVYTSSLRRARSPSVDQTEEPVASGSDWLWLTGVNKKHLRWIWKGMVWYGMVWVIISKHH